MANNFTTDPNCVALWRMESGALTVDSIGTNTLTNHGVAEDAANFKEGACAADFELTESDYMHIADADLSAGFPFKTGGASKKFSLTFWVKFESIAGVMRLFSKGSTTDNHGLNLDITAAGVLQLYYGIYYWNIATIVTGRWYHIGIFGDGVAKTATVRIWDDTASTATTYTNTFAGEITLGYGYELFIGAHNNGVLYFLDGLLDEFIIFKDELTVAEIDLIRTGSFGAPLLAGTIAAVATLQGNITGVSTLLESTITAVSSVTGELTGGGLALGTATVSAVASLTGILTAVLTAVNAIPASTGGWAMGGAGVWGGSTPGTTIIPADAEPTGFYLGGGAAEGEAEVVSTIPSTDEIVAKGAAFIFCGPGATGNAATLVPAQDVIVAVVGFVLGGAGTWGQVAPADLPSTALVGSGGFVLSGSGFSLDPGVAPTSTVIVPTGGWKLGGSRPDPVEVAYPGNFDRVIEETAAFEMGGNEGSWESSVPPSTVIPPMSAAFALSGAGLCTSKIPSSALIVTGEGGYVLAGATPAEVFEAWVLSGQAFEPSVWSAFNFNSFAVKGGQAYACGDAGIYLLGGDHDAGEPIQSGARVGPVNFSSAGTKRIRGVVFGQGGTSTRVRVRTDEAEGVFAPNRDTDRVTVSRDLQASEFIVDILNFEELSHLEIFPLRLARR